jgi:hypothetical protein
MGQGFSTNSITSQTLSMTQQLVNNDMKSLQSSTDTKASELLTKYTTLYNNINTTIRDISGTSSEILSAKQNQYNSELIELNLEKKNILQSSLEINTIFVFKTLTYTAGMVFAIIIISHVFISESIYYKIFYCIWGAMLYPIVLLYGVYDAPSWKALLIPLVDTSNMSPSSKMYAYLIFPFKYSAFSEDGIESHSKSKYALQAFSAVCLICFGIAYMN